MTYLTDHILSLTIFSPLIGIFLILFVPRRFEEGARVISLTASLLTAAITYHLWKIFVPSPSFSFQENIPWIPSLGINYHVGIDGASLLLAALTSLLMPLCIAASWNEIKSRRKEFYSLLLLCQIGLTGVFCAMDLFLFYIFWEVMLIPMYFLIGIWGSGNRIYVALKFLLYTMFGSVLMLVGVIYLYLVSGRSFDMPALGAGRLDPNVQLWLFLSFALAFAIKVPLFPFHTWLPDAHTEAPTAGSALLAGVFLKVGAYGFYRIAMPYFPDAVAVLRPYIFILAVVSIIYGALLSMVQTDFKRLIAYSSVSHLGFVMLGLIALNPEGAQGALLQMVNHGISTGALFLLFGMLYYRSHTRNIADFGGIARGMPLYSGIFIFVGLSSLGLPGLNNFVGELLTLLGAFRVKPLFAIISASCVILAAVYILWSVERVFFGKAKTGAYKDMNGREIALILPLLAAILWLGVYPKTALSRIGESTGLFLQMAKRSIIEEPRAPLDVRIPELYKRIPSLLITPMSPVTQDRSKISIPEATGVMEPWNKESGDAPEFTGVSGSDREFGLEKVPVEEAPAEERPLGGD